MLWKHKQLLILAVCKGEGLAPLITWVTSMSTINTYLGRKWKVEALEWKSVFRAFIITSCSSVWGSLLPLSSYVDINFTRVMKINRTRPSPSVFATCKRSEPGGPGSKTTWWALFHICILVPRPSHHPVFGDSPILLCAIDPGCTWVHALSLPSPLMRYWSRLYVGTRSFPLLPSYALLIQAVRGYTLFPSPSLLCAIDPGCMCMWVHALPLPSYVRQSMDCRKLVDVWQTPFKLRRDCQRLVDVRQTPYIIYGLQPRRRTVYVTSPLTCRLYMGSVL